ncbi:MAG: (Fe-S)-binding protein, partial [Candidatus Bathyarchaeota archaeon]|nr:(Fe-S)-binding protein [Candidatus Bathyarchaeota archaeon]
ELEKTGASTVVTSCPGCHKMLNEEYKKRYKLNLEAEIVHSSTFFNNLLKKGVLKFRNNIGKAITYHDPCHLGRYSGIYEDPRDLLQNMPGVKVIEMPRNKQNAWCCGGGGGVRAGFPGLSSFAASERVKEAKETGAEAIVSSCPFCYINLSDAIEQYNEKMEVYDVVDLINMSIK